MNAQKRLEPMSSASDIFQMPTILYFPALLLSVAIAGLSFFVEPFSLGYFAGGILAAAMFAFLIFVGVIVPAKRASTLKREGISTTATVLKKEKRSRTIGTLEPDNRMRVASTYVTFEFTPEGASQPLRLKAEVNKATSTMQEGKSMKITYAKSNPRIVKLPGE